MLRHDIMTLYLVLLFVSVNYTFNEKKKQSTKYKVELVNETVALSELEFDPDFF